MCTVTLLPMGDHLRVMANRDERHDRPSAHPPLISRAGSALALMPVDPQSGGTWIAATSAGLVFALLNGTGEAAATAPSRGRLILELLDCMDLGQVTARAQSLTWRGWPPHRLLVSDGRRTLELRVRPGGFSMDTYEIRGPLGFTSVPPGDVEAEPARRALFDRVVAAAADPLDGQDGFHRHRWPDRPHLSVHMRRHDYATQSITTVDVTPTRVRMRYETTREVVGQPAWLSIERRHTRLVALAS
ncbi:MAG: NRDE family protein [Vicinamibacterales bacterium]